MREYWELRQTLADLYYDSGDWRRVAQDCGIDPAELDLQGNALDAWSLILEGLATQKKFGNLRVVLLAQYPHKVAILDRFLDLGLQRDLPLVGLPDIGSLEIQDEELKPRPIMTALARIDSIPTSWLQLACEVTAVSANELAQQLGPNASSTAAARLNQIRAQHATTMEAFRDRSNLENNRLRRATEEIARINGLYRPQEPTLNLVSTMDQELQLRQHWQRSAQYRAELEAFQNAQAKLPQVQAQEAQAQQELSEIKAEISRENARGLEAERAFQQDLNDALDRDVLEGLSRILHDAALSLRTTPGATRGFLALLIVGCMAGRIKEILSQVATIAAFGQLFDQAMEELRNGVVAKGREIARDSLRAPLTVQRLISQNRKLLDLLSQMLSKADPAEVKARHSRLNELFAGLEFKLPSYEGLELPTEIARAQGHLNDLSKFMNLRIIQLQEVQAEPPSSLDQQLDEAKAKGEEILESASSHKQEGAEVLTLTKYLFGLFRHAGSSESLPPLISQFCRALGEEGKALVGQDVEIEMRETSASRFGLKAIEELFETHESMLYLKSRAKLSGQLRASAERLEAINNALGSLEGAIDTAASRYRKKLTVLAYLVLLPVVGIPLSVYESILLRRLKRLVASADPRYCTVGILAVRLTTLSGILSSIISAAAIWAVADGPLTAQYLFGWGLAAATVGGALMTFHNWWVARSLAL